MASYDRRPIQKQALAGGPDPHSLKAFLSEYEMGKKRGQDEALDGKTPVPLTSQGVVAQEEVVSAALEVRELLDRVIRVGKGGNVRIDPRRFSARLSQGLSTLLYNAGLYDGLHENFSKSARLPAGSRWRGGPDDRDLSVLTPNGEWVLNVKSVDDKKSAYELTLKKPSKELWRWGNTFKKRDDATKEAELVAQALKKLKDFSMAGWKKV